MSQSPVFIKVHICNLSQSLATELDEIKQCTPSAKLFKSYSNMNKPGLWKEIRKRQSKGTVFHSANEKYFYLNSMYVQNSYLMTLTMSLPAKYTKLSEANGHYPKKYLQTLQGLNYLYHQKQWERR